MPPVREKLLLRISAPIVPKAQKGKPVSRHSDFYLLAEETMSLDGLSLGLRSTIDALRRIYMQWRKNLTYYYNSRNCDWNVRNLMFCSCRELQKIMENKSELGKVDLGSEYRKLLQEILDSEYLDASGEFLLRFDKEMMYLSPEKSVAQAFLDEMPCSPKLESIRRCIQDYLDGKTEMIYSPERW